MHHISRLMGLAFLDRNRETLRHNMRIARLLRGLDRLTDLDAVREQQARRGKNPP